MKRFLALALVLFALASVSAPAAFAAYPGSDRDERLNSSDLSFSKLYSVTYLQLASGSSKALTPTDVTATNTVSTAYWSRSVPSPFKMVINSASATPLMYAYPYETTTAGVIVPTATCAYLPWDTNLQWSKIFTGKPNLSFAPSAVTTWTIEIWVQP